MMRSTATKPQATLKLKRTISGTNSPPLEATGEEKPMGRASVDREYNAGFVSDWEQRKEYFESQAEEQPKSDVSKAHKAGSIHKKAGQSMADKMSERT
ncbi:hypothetical protein M413DRAFT_440590 [Hebeloma cylindrosporum]|uniref:Uncharacterized protein n=1 Tax=Hebeloma cylindrosporum TaxID=76867 RepID=A0A0C3CSI4_HEBCY|nr:hypothetical protein M413DRAFT_440590 [Hebeloma cylindrosporum h7]